VDLSAGVIRSYEVVHGERVTLAALGLLNLRGRAQRVRCLPRIVIDGVSYLIDDQLGELRAVDAPHTTVRFAA
jgi:hypothetical protein